MVLASEGVNQEEAPGREERTERVEGFWRKIGRAHAPTGASIKNLLHIMALNPPLQASSWQCCSQSLLHNFTNSWSWTAVKDKPLRKALWPVYTIPLFAAGAWVICHKIPGSQLGNPGTVDRARESNPCGQGGQACREYLPNWNLKGKSKLVWPVGPTEV